MAGLDKTNWVVMGLLVLFFLESLVVTFRPRKVVAGKQQMRWSLFALSATFNVIWICTVLEYILLRRGVVAWVAVLALILHWLALALRITAIRTLGRFWSLQVEIRKEHTLVREGVYNVVRHPAYAAIMVEVLSEPVVANAWWSLGLGVVTLVPLLLLRMRREERAMVEQFGDQYRRYREEVGALVPRWSALRRLWSAQRSGS
jgi:protein-S-isoprenylcysteine O-methyltransferase Ste14